MRNKENGKSGVAMIVVLVMIVIFSSLILAVVLSSTTAIRRAHFYKDKLVATEIAEAGIQDALYWMNYKGHYNHRYPCTDPTTGDCNINYKYFRGSNWDGVATETWTSSSAPKNLNYNPSKIEGGICVVEFEDENESAIPNLDTIISTGYYKGRSAEISVRIRGKSGNGNSEHDVTAINDRWLCDWGWDGSDWKYGVATWGIPEALNKHVIYAKNVSGTANKIKGNIFTVNNTLSATDTSESTITITYSNHFDDFVIPDTSNWELPDFSGPDCTYSDTGYVYDSVYPSGTDVNSISDGVYWETGPSFTYYFGKANDGSTPETYITTGSVEVDANAILADGSPTIIQNYFKVDGELTISDDITTETQQQSAFETTSGAITITSGIEINGNLVIKGQAISLDSITINGCIACDNGITLNNSITIDSTNSLYPSAILIYNSSGDATLTIGSSPAITLGDEQDAAIIVYSDEVGEQANVVINDDLNTITNLGFKPCIIDFSTTDTALVNIGATSNVQIKGLIYSYGGGGVKTGKVIFDGATSSLDGSIVANGPVEIKNGTITYDSTPFQEVYKGFVGGRRVYLPVVGSWKFE